MGPNKWQISHLQSMYSSLRHLTLYLTIFESSDLSQHLSTFILNQIAKIRSNPAIRLITKTIKRCTYDENCLRALLFFLRSYIVCITLIFVKNSRPTASAIASLLIQYKRSLEKAIAGPYVSLAFAKMAWLKNTAGVAGDKWEIATSVRWCVVRLVTSWGKRRLLTAHRKENEG